MQIKVIRPNAEMGILAHVAGIVNAKKGGTLAELREDINHSLPGYLGSVRYLFISRKMKIIDPRTETQLVLSALYKKTVYVKVFHGAGKVLEMFLKSEMARDSFIYLFIYLFSSIFFFYTKMSKISEKKVTKENAMGNRLEAITKKLDFQYLLDQNCIGK